MKTLERDDWRVQPAAASRRAERAAARQAFERALQHSPGEQQQGGREDPGRSEPAGLLHEVIAFLQRSLNSVAGLPGPAALQSMARQIASSVGHAVQFAQVSSTGCWRLRMRLPEALIALSEIDIACRPGQLRIVLRTASVEAYEQLRAARPELDRALQQRQLAAEPAQIVLVEPLDLW